MNTEEIPMNHSGKCACGEVEFTFTGDPINSAYCYCHSCQFRTNADRWFGVWVPRENLTFTRGKPSSFIRKGDSGKTVDFFFCGNCGINLAGFAEIGDFYSVAASVIENSAQFPPQMLIYTAHAPEGTIFPEGVPRYDQLPPRDGR